MKAVAMNKPLTSAIIRKNMQASYMADDLGINKTSLSHMRSTRKMPINVAADIADYLEDDQFSQEAASKFFGVISFMIERKIVPDVFARKIRQQEEQEERENLDKEVQKILMKVTEYRTNDDIERVKRYLSEFTDEVMAELSFMFMVAENINISMLEIAEQRQAYWTTQ